LTVFETAQLTKPPPLAVVSDFPYNAKEIIPQGYKYLDISIPPRYNFLLVEITWKGKIKMFYLSGSEQLNKAIERAKAYKPAVKMVEFGLYNVSGESGQNYLVDCQQDEQGRRVVACNCKGGQRGLVCKHAAALQAHIYRAALRQGRQPFA
jgi:hypothetical protein